ncbi:MAG: hypothetical protein AB7T18_05470 [Alphaproteobacteria bacterium]
MAVEPFDSPLRRVANWWWSFAPLRAAQPAQRDEFARNVADASALMEFMVRERERVPDQIIEDIEAASDLLASRAVPSKDERVRFLRAYRDLIAVPRCAIAYDGIPPTTFWSPGSLWPTLLLYACFVPSIILLFVSYWYGSVIFAVASALLFAATSALTIWGLYVFTGVATDNKLNQMIQLCYLYTAIFLAGSLFPFFSPYLFHLSPSGEAPLGVLRGCAQPIGGNPPPKDVLCAETGKPDNYQWIVRIGGIVDKWVASAPSETGQPPVTGQPAVDAAEKKGLVRGGLVVPLYVIVLALFGGAVSMTRRVPEYQRRAMDSQDSLTNVQARENLVFQIMQVVSAPLIAVTAYYIVNPDNAVTSVVLGFGSGFASEPILLMIRGLVEKISPAQASQPTAVTVSVSPPSATLAPKEAKQFRATVLGSTNAQVTWSIDPADGSAGTVSQSGYYMAPDSAAGKVATIIARSVADPTKSGSVSIKIEEPDAKVEAGVKVTPPAPTVRAGQDQQFSADVSGLSNRNITWELDPPGAASGTISDGKYTAPAAITVASVKVIARSAADSTKFGSATITLQP